MSWNSSLTLFIFCSPSALAELHSTDGKCPSRADGGMVSWHETKCRFDCYESRTRPLRNGREIFWETNWPVLNWFLAFQKPIKGEQKPIKAVQKPIKAFQKPIKASRNQLRCSRNQLRPCRNQLRRSRNQLRRSRNQLRPSRNQLRPCRNQLRRAETN